MHEMSIITALIDQIHTHLPEQAHLDRAIIEIGALEHLDPEIMQLAWESCKAEAGFDGAVLEIEYTNLQISCRACGTSFTPEDPACLICPECGTAQPEVLNGKGVVLKTIEATTEKKGASSTRANARRN